MALARERSSSTFMREMIAEVNEQRQDEPTNTGLYNKLIREVGDLKMKFVACQREEVPPEIVTQALIEIAAYSLRLAAEGDPQVRNYRWPYE